MKEKIWVLFSIANEYDQPNANLKAWWCNKPTFKQLSAAADRFVDDKEGDGPVGEVMNGKEVRIKGLDYRLVGVPPNAVIVDPPEIECCKCGWLGDYRDLIAPTSDHEPSCPECLGDDFVEVEDDSDRREGFLRKLGAILLEVWYDGRN